MTIDVNNSFDEYNDNNANLKIEPEKLRKEIAEIKNRGKTQVQMQVSEKSKYLNKT